MAAAAHTFRNPVIWEDLPDMEIIRVGKDYYMSVSSFAFSPGAPILHSRNLVDWEHFGHSVPRLDFGERFSLDGTHSGSYGKGIWASTFRFRPGNGLFYWYGAIQGTERTVIYTAEDPRHAWTPRGSIDKFFYDAGLLIDDDDSMYLAYGTKTICVSQLSEDGMNEQRSEPVYTSDEYLEGARMYHIGGAYYIWLTRPFAGQYVLKSEDGPFGPYECRQVIGEILSPIAGSGWPHQGSLFDTDDGRWYYMAFMDGYPGGRVPVLAPVHFNEAGWPEVQYDKDANPTRWCLEYAMPISNQDAQRPNRCFKRHAFSGEALEPCWEWNHNPDDSKWGFRDGRLMLQTATITDCLFLASNTLSHRIIGPRSVATFCIDVSMMTDGDRTGVAMFRNDSAYIGVHKDGDACRVVYVDGLKMSAITTPTGWMNAHPVALDWKVDSRGKVQTSTALEAARLWLRVMADVTPAFSHGLENERRCASFEYSIDGEKYLRLGPDFALDLSALGYVGYRWGIFNFASRALGGKVLVEECKISSWDEGQ